MSVYSSFDFDLLTPERFQELCNAILVNHFSQLIEPHGRPGRDGGSDADLTGEPISYREFLGRPLPSQALDGTARLWIFQHKHIREEGDKNRQRAIVAALRKEVSRWRATRRKRPTHYYLLTNVNLKRSTTTALKKEGKLFARFEVWGEAKLAAFVAGSAPLQNAFFPGLGKVNETLSKLLDGVERLGRVTDNPPREHGRRSRPTRRRSGKATSDIYLAAIDKLVEYEVSFLRMNEAFIGQLQWPNTDAKVPADWRRIVIKSPKSGLLTLSHDRRALSAVVTEFQQRNAAIVLWERYIGEQTDRGDVVVTVSCHPLRTKKVEAALTRLLKVVPGKNTAHLLADEQLRSIQGKLISDIKQNRIEDAQDGLVTLFDVRRAYSERKRKYPTSFYPNMRTFGRIAVVGWDFNTLWERVFESVADVAFSGQYPKQFYRLLISLPFELCLSALRNRLPIERYQVELSATHTIFRILCEKNDSALFAVLLDKLDDLATAVGDQADEVKTDDEITWASEVSVASVEYFANLAQFAMKQGAAMSPDQFVSLIQRAGNLTFVRWDSLVVVGRQDERRSQAEEKTHHIADEYIFALATYAWFLQRRDGTWQVAAAVALLSQLPIRRIVELYQRKTDSREGWFGTWFWPEGKRVSWSGRIDHDIRDSLQLAILNLPVEEQELSPLRLFEQEAPYKEFVREVEALDANLRQRGMPPRNDLRQVLEALAGARRRAEEVWKDSIRNIQVFSPKKLTEIRDSFRETLRNGDLDGFLYVVEETGPSETEKPTHFVGVFSIHEKVWFLDDTGYSYYSVGGMGSQWADSILHGREDLLIKAARKIATHITYNPGELEALLGKLKSAEDQGRILLASHRTISWQVRQAYFTGEPDLSRANVPEEKGRHGRLGNLDAHTSHFLRVGELMIVPKAGFAWRTPKRIDEPQLELIDPASATGQRIAEQHPAMDLRLNCVINARELGTMRPQSTDVSVELYRLAGQSVDDDPDAETDET
jgi:hypothetical protein